MASVPAAASHRSRIRQMPARSSAIGRTPVNGAHATPGDSGSRSRAPSRSDSNTTNEYRAARRSTYCFWGRTSGMRSLARSVLSSASVKSSVNQPVTLLSVDDLRRLRAGELGLGYPRLWCRRFRFRDVRPARRPWSRRGQHETQRVGRQGGRRFDGLSPPHSGYRGGAVGCKKYEQVSAVRQRSPPPPSSARAPRACPSRRRPRGGRARGLRGSTRIEVGSTETSSAPHRLLALVEIDAEVGELPVGL